MLDVNAFGVWLSVLNLVAVTSGRDVDFEELGVLRVENILKRAGEV